MDTDGTGWTLKKPHSIRPSQSCGHFWTGVNRISSARGANGGPLTGADRHRRLEPAQQSLQPSRILFWTRRLAGFCLCCNNTFSPHTPHAILFRFSASGGENFCSRRPSCSQSQEGATRSVGLSVWAWRNPAGVVPTAQSKWLAWVAPRSSRHVVLRSEVHVAPR